MFEKNQEILEAVTYILTEEGYKVNGFTSEKLFLDGAAEEKPDLILLDVIQITLEGTELCRQLKILEDIKHIPVIVLSTHTKANEVKQICADEVIQKPFDIDNLLEVVENHLAA
ncbi:response regulator transcription factor [Desertivirga arenae]|uniref:response regulator transcription factor n=1 Tax=Desertivirga arenae TaxID=2810309 RepID=UPI001A970505